MANKLDAIRQLYHAIERADMGGAFRFRDMESMAGELAKAGRALTRIHESECSGVERWDPQIRRHVATWTDEDQARADKAIERHRAKASAAVDRLNAECNAFTISFNRDPRGAAIRLFVAPDYPESGTPSAFF